MLYLPSQKPQMETFSILRDENRLIEGWGGAAQHWSGKKLCSSYPSKITQKQISDRAHPLHRENDTSRYAVFGGSQAQIRACLSIEAKNHLSDDTEISGVMEGTPQYLIFVDTKSWRFLIIIREDINLRKFVKLEDFAQN